MAVQPPQKPSISPPSEELLEKIANSVINPETKTEILWTVVSPILWLRSTFDFSHTTFSHCDIIELLSPTPLIYPEFASIAQNLPDQVTFQRLDVETLEARCSWPQGVFVLRWYDQSPFVDWALKPSMFGQQAPPDIENFTPGWRLERIVTSESPRDSMSDWEGHPSIKEADKSFQGKKTESPANDDDDYWAMYDRELNKDGEDQGEDEDEENSNGLKPPKSSRTPAKSPAISISEEDYFNRYDDVQPALDRDDPPPQGLEKGLETKLSFEEKTSSQSLDSPMASHIKATITSLFKVARSTGIDKAQFMKLVADTVGTESES